MIHLSLNTGHTYTVPAGKVERRTINALSHMVVSNGGLIPHCAPWRTVIAKTRGGATFDIRRNDRDMVTLNAVAWTPEGAAEVWDALESTYMTTAETLAKNGLAQNLEMPEMPETLPWLATWILPTATMAINPQEIGWMADFEQCLAATLIAKAKPTP